MGYVLKLRKERFPGKKCDLSVHTLSIYNCAHTRGEFIFLTETTAKCKNSHSEKNCQKSKARILC